MIVSKINHEPIIVFSKNLARWGSSEPYAQAAKVDGLFHQAAEGHSLLFLGKIVLVETVWVLQSVYDQPRDRIAESLAKLVVKPGIRCEDGQVTIDALYRFKETKLDIVDCFLAAEAAAEGDAVATFDKGFCKFSDVSLWDHE